MTRQAYIEKFRDIVREAVHGTGLFASVMMAQAILESADKNGIPGNSTLARVYHNHFGIKSGTSWRGKRVNLRTREVLEGKCVTMDDYFRVYDDATQSFRDRVRFLIRNGRYMRHGVFRATTPQAQADALQAAGYATDPHYARLLKLLIERHKLTTLDDGPGLAVTQH